MKAALLDRLQACSALMKTPAAALSAILLAALTASSAVAQAPGTTHVTIKNPDPAKWAGRTGFFSKSSGEFTCRPLACPAAAQVSASISTSPTRSPDPQALAKLAARIPNSVAEANTSLASSMTPGRKLERLSSGTTTLRGYPAIVQDLRITGEKGPAYFSKALIF